VSTSNIREVFLVSNKHKFYNWDTIFPVPYQNVHIYETFGIHPKFLPEQDLYSKLSHLENIFANKLHSASGRQIVGIGEAGLDETSQFSLDYQKLAFEQQVLMARNTNLPLILHCRGHSLFSSMLDCIESILSPTHPVQWHCVKSDSDLEVIDRFISIFLNSVVSLNGASTHIRDIDQDKVYKKWIRNHPTLLKHLVLETDCPWLCPKNLPIHQFNPCTGIFIVSKWLEDVLRAPGKNASTIIRIANDNAKNIFQLPM
jgi:Tat protein secretion system quality control protein TatD with DNase activity